jgi:phosphopantothenoylcysteine decarboxylase/phosphopantothenoylcysteine decarboxylase/phosphopantothenate--cysteine ligase
MNILLGITGSIAAYKACDIANALTKDGHDVHVIMTRAAQKFVTPLAFQTLTKHKVYTDMFDEFVFEDVRHISLAQAADAALIAPASANIIGKLRGGIADDPLSTVIMAAHKKPVVIAPAMNTAMYENPVVQENIQKLTRLGYHFIPPREALLACGDVGQGALAETGVIISELKRILGI